MWRSTVGAVGAPQRRTWSGADESQAAYLDTPSFRRILGATRAANAVRTLIATVFHVRPVFAVR